LKVIRKRLQFAANVVGNHAAGDGFIDRRGIAIVKRLVGVQRHWRRPPERDASSAFASIAGLEKRSASLPARSLGCPLIDCGTTPGASGSVFASGIPINSQTPETGYA
jgi:hypothetical protein